MKHVLTLLFILIAGMALAGTIKTWNTGETLKAADLNSNFAHVHNAAEATVTDSKVASNAAISHSKLATPALVPKAWAYVYGPCSTSPCTIGESSGVTSIARDNTGQYTITVTRGLTDTEVAVLVTPRHGNGSQAFCWVYTLSAVNETVTIQCDDSTVGTGADMGFSFLLMDAE